MPDAATRIGTLREKPLHASLKRWYARAGDLTEAPVDGYVIDLVRGELLIEIQTRGFSTLRPKLASLLAHGHHVRVVHPIAIDRWIVQVDPEGTVLARRRSPRHGGLPDLASELVSFPELLAHPRFELEVLLIREEEYRIHELGRCWRRRGWTVVERRLVDVIDQVVLARVEDLACMLPAGMPDLFTTVDLAARIGRPRRLAQQMTYCLRLAGLIEIVGKRGGAAEYRVATREPLVGAGPGDG